MVLKVPAVHALNVTHATHVLDVTHATYVPDVMHVTHVPDVTHATHVPDTTHATHAPGLIPQRCPVNGEGQLHVQRSSRLTHVPPF